MWGSQNLLYLECFSWCMVFILRHTAHLRLVADLLPGHVIFFSRQGIIHYEIPKTSIYIIYFMHKLINVFIMSFCENLLLFCKNALADIWMYFYLTCMSVQHLQYNYCRNSKSDPVMLNKSNAASQNCTAADVQLNYDWQLSNTALKIILMFLSIYLFSHSVTLHGGVVRLALLLTVRRSWVWYPAGPSMGFLPVLLIAPIV